MQRSPARPQSCSTPPGRLPAGRAIDRAADYVKAYSFPARHRPYCLKKDFLALPAGISRNQTDSDHPRRCLRKARKLIEESGVDGARGEALQVDGVSNHRNRQPGDCFLEIDGDCPEDGYRSIYQWRGSAEKIADERAQANKIVDMPDQRERTAIGQCREEMGLDAVGVDDVGPEVEKFPSQFA